MGARPTFAALWLEQRRLGAIAVQRVEDDELRRITDDEARAQTEALLSAAPIALMSADRRDRSGFVEQQRVFARSRR